MVLLNPEGLVWIETRLSFVSLFRMPSDISYAMVLVTWTFILLRIRYS